MSSWTTTEVARRLGVGTSTVKRWADEGLLASLRTAGKHRRFDPAEVERFRASAEAASRRPQTVGGGAETDAARLLGARDPREVEALLLLARAAARDWAEAGDRIGAALMVVGKAWESGAITVLDEHRLSGLLLRSLSRIADSFPTPPSPRRALLAAPAGEEHVLGLALVEVVLREAGWRTEWSGARTPTKDLASAIGSGAWDLVCLSAAEGTDVSSLRRLLRPVGAAARRSSTHLMTGGNARWARLVRPSSHFGTLRAFRDVLESLR